MLEKTELVALAAAVLGGEPVPAPARSASSQEPSSAASAPSAHDSADTEHEDVLINFVSITGATRLTLVLLWCSAMLG
jgi:hypothetical protein